jgi:hypothetical protein
MAHGPYVWDWGLQCQSLARFLWSCLRRVRVSRVQFPSAAKKFQTHRKFANAALQDRSQGASARRVQVRQLVGGGDADGNCIYSAEFRYCPTEFTSRAWSHGSIQSILKIVKGSCWFFQIMNRFVVRRKISDADVGSSRVMFRHSKGNCKHLCKGNRKGNVLFSCIWYLARLKIIFILVFHR